MMVALHASIHNCSISLLSDSLSCCVTVDPIGISPHLRINLAELHRSTCVVHYSLFECLVKVSIIEKDVWIVEPSIEMPFHRFYRLDHTLQLLIPCQNHQCRIRSFSIRLRLETTGHEDFIVILAYLPVAQSEYMLITQTHGLNEYRIVGGAPAGIIRLPGEEGCRTMSTIINVMTIHGNNSTAPSGTEIFELPFNRMRLLKKDDLGMKRSFSSVKSTSEGREGAEGSRFTRFLAKPIPTTSLGQQAQKERPGEGSKARNRYDMTGTVQQERRRMFET